jgi:MFS family permease
MNNDTPSARLEYRRNFAALLADSVFCTLALLLLNVGSVLPAFARQLTSSPPAVGLVGTVFRAGLLLPQIVVARLIGPKPRKKPTMMVGMSGRILVWVLVLALGGGLADSPQVMFVLFLICLGLLTAGEGIVSVARFDILARAVPLQRRGRLLGAAQFIGGLAGIGIGGLVAFVLGNWPFPRNYMMLFALAGSVYALSSLALLTVREPPLEEADLTPDSPHDSGRGSWIRHALQDRAFRRLLSCRVMIGMMELAAGFYVIHAADALQLPERIIGAFVLAQTIGGAGAAILLGWVCEQHGPRHVIRIAAAIAPLAPLFALMAHVTGSRALAWAYPFVYVVIGLMNSSWMLGFFNYIVEIAPDRMRPFYLGLGNTILGIMTILPVIGGWILQASSYTVLFAMTALLLCIGFVLALRLTPAQRDAGIDAADQSIH